MVLLKYFIPGRAGQLMTDLFCLIISSNKHDWSEWREAVGRTWRCVLTRTFPFLTSAASRLALYSVGQSPLTPPPPQFVTCSRNHGRPHKFNSYCLKCYRYFSRVDSKKKQLVSKHSKHVVIISGPLHMYWTALSLPTFPQLCFVGFLSHRWVSLRPCSVFSFFIITSFLCIGMWYRKFCNVGRTCLVN